MRCNGKPEHVVQLHRLVGPHGRSSVKAQHRWGKIITLLSARQSANSLANSGGSSGSRRRRNEGRALARSTLWAGPAVESWLLWGLRTLAVFDVSRDNSVTAQSGDAYSNWYAYAFGVCVRIRSKPWEVCGSV